MRKRRPQSKSIPTTQHAVSLTCFFLSGFAGLVYEVAWIRQSALLFGSTTFAVSAVLAVFFLGLAIGAHLFGRIGQQTPRPLILFAHIEIALALLALISPYTFDLADLLYGIAYRTLIDHTILLFLTRLILIALVILPPTILMGGTLPLFCRQYAHNNNKIAHTVGLLYGINTLGAALGCAATGFVLLPDLGLRGAIWVGVACNLLSGLIVRNLPIAQKETPPSPTPTEIPPERRIVFILFFTVGFVALGAEVLWTRYLGLLINNTVYTYTFTLAIVLIGLVLGSILASQFSDKTTSRAHYFGSLQIITGLCILTLMMLSPGTWRELGTGLQVYFLLLLPPAILSGATFPLAIRLAIKDASQTSSITGSLIAVNTLGGILGSLLIGFIGIPFFGLEKSLLFITGANLAIGITAWFWLERKHHKVKYAATATAILLYVAIPYYSQTQIPADFIGEGRDLVDYHEGYGANMAAVQRDGDLELEIDRWWQGGSKKNHQIMAAHVPMLLHPDPKNILVVGIGTGQTASRFLIYPINQLACVDIEPTLFPFIQQHFDTDWMSDPRVQIISEDGRNHLRHTAATYDIISLELGEISRPGVAFFYTTDFYRRTQQRLNTNGYLIQFVPLRFLTETQFRGIVRSFISIYPNSILWYNTSELLLIGTSNRNVTINRNQIDQRLADKQIQTDLKYSHWGGIQHYLNQSHVFLGGYLMGSTGLANLATGTETYTDNHPILDYTTVQNTTEPTQELALLKILHRYLEPINTLIPNETDTTITIIREKNLREIAARVFVRQASDLIPTRNHSRIATLCFEAIRHHPEHLDAHRMFADAMMQLGRLQDAEKHYAEVLRLNPTDARALNGHAVTLHRTGRLEEAIHQYKEAIRHYPNNSLSQNGIAMALHRLGRLDESIHHYKEAIRLRPNRPDTYADLGTALMQANRVQEAVPYLEKALQLQPNFPRAQNILAQVRAQAGTPSP